MNDPREDRELVAAVLLGATGALEPWWSREHPRTWRLCLGFLADEAEADDAAQDAMLHLFDHLADWDQGRPWGSWRTTVVLNLCRDRLRRRATRQAAEAGAAIPHDLPSALPSPDDAAQAAEVRTILLAALRHLPPREREAFVLKDLQEQDTAEVAIALGVTEGTVRSLLTLARRRLRQLLGARLQEAAS